MLNLEFVIVLLLLLLTVAVAITGAFKMFRLCSWCMNHSNALKHAVTVADADSNAIMKYHRNPMSLLLSLLLIIICFLLLLEI